MNSSMAMKLFNILLFCTPIYVGLTLSISAHAGGIGLLKKYDCASCHALTGPAPATLAALWQRKGPDLFYAGNKYRQAWLETWLQQPKRIRPAGMFYMNHIKPGPKRNMVDTSTLTEHIQLNKKDAKAIAATLASMKTHTALIQAEKHDASISPGPLGEMLFDKIYGCMACHQIEPGFGGMSGTEVYTAGKRLTPEFMLSYIRNPQAWDPKIWMPNAHLPDNNKQKLVNYIIKLSKESNDE